MQVGTRRVPRLVTAAAVTVAATAFGAGFIGSRMRGTGPRAEPLELTASHRAGSGSPLLLLHGVSAIWRAWTPVLPYLEPHHDVIVPTLLGHAGGLLLSPGVEPSVDALVDGIEAELDALGLRKVHIVGNSLGGWIGIELARRGRALSLVLFSPAGAWKSQRHIELRALAIRRSVKASSRLASRADTVAAIPLVRQLLLGAQVAHPDRVDSGLLAAFIRAGGAAPSVDALLRAIPLKQVESLPAIRNYPVRLVWSGSDRVLPFRGFGDVMAERLPGAEVVHLAGVGHVPMSDDPHGVAEQILQVTSVVDATATSSEAEG
jgi:pimeloyl-ACP methyl ester carboxylesterase